jgi:hypothetical protein
MISHSHVAALKYFVSSAPERPDVTDGLSFEWYTVYVISTILQDRALTFSS